MKTSTSFSSDIQSIWDQNKERLLSYILKRVPDRETAKDLLQEVLLKFYEYQLSKHDLHHPSAWLHQVTHHVIMDHFRKGKKETKLHQQLTYLEESASEQNLIQAAANCIRPLLKGIEDKYAVPLVWADLEGLSQQQVADRLGISLSGAKSRIQRARQKLKELLLLCCQVSINHQGQLLSFAPKEDCCLFQNS